MKTARDNLKPLAEELRPLQLSDVIGQEHLLGKNQFLRTIIEKGQPVSMILWGPPGSGKTTLARIVAKSGDFEYTEISAVAAGIAQVKEVIKAAKAALGDGRKTVLFVDEIHRFNKAQQDAFLPHVENGTIILIGATTENPSFEVIGPLLSRSRVLVLEPLSKEDIVQIVTRASKNFKGRKLEDEAVELLS